MKKNVRTPEDIRYDISQLEYKKENLEKELEISLMVHNEESFSKYIGKWVYCNFYEAGFCYVYVLGVKGDPEDDLQFYGYGIEYDYQNKNLQIICKDYPDVFHIYYPKNILEMEPRQFIKEILFDFLNSELSDNLNIELEN